MQIFKRISLGLFLFFGFLVFLGCNQQTAFPKENQEPQLRIEPETKKLETNKLQSSQVQELKTGKISDNLEIIRHYYNLNQDGQGLEDNKDKKIKDNLLDDSKDRRIDLYKLDAKQLKIQFLNDLKKPKSLEEWADVFKTKTKDDFILINGSYFNEDYQPTGFYKIDGEIKQINKFDLDKSGVLAFGDKGLILDDLEDITFESLSDYEFILQSYPVLIKDGEANISKDSGKKASRTAVGIDKDGYIYIIMALYGDLSLFEFSQILDKLEIEFEEVLNLDGGTSSGVYLRNNGYTELENSIVTVPNAVVLLTN